MQASLAAVGFVAAQVAWLQGAGGLVMTAGVLLGLVIPFTLLVIMPTNERLLNPTLDRGSSEAANLLRRWGRLHAVRSAASGMAFTMLVWHLVHAHLQ